MNDSDALWCRGLDVRYGDTQVLRDLELSVGRGETVALLGPSGSGKTTLLYAIAGLVPVTGGEIAIGGRGVSSDEPPERRRIGMVFQNYALWPHMNALETVAYPIVQRGVPSSEARTEAASLLSSVGIGDLGHRLPGELSGGQQQRVGVARALATRPDLFLFDEPTAHLDSGMRTALQTHLLETRQRGATGALYTTHDAAEALAVGDRVGVLRDGALVQIDRPSVLYGEPIDAYVAGLTGSGSFLDARLDEVGDGSIVVSVDDISLEIPGGAAASPGPVALIVRPEWLSLQGPLPGTVVANRYEGPHIDHDLATDWGTVQIRSTGSAHLEIGSRQAWGIDRAWAVSREQVS
jgi:ABC-type Fe3+/spermidine/putrescine transport system ATPase subunit